MDSRPQEQWCQELSGQHIDKYELTSFIGAGKIGYVYLAKMRDLEHAPLRAIKLTFHTRQGGDEELRKVMALALVEGVVHFHDLGAKEIRHAGRTHLCQFTVWDYIAPGRNLRTYLRDSQNITTDFLLAVVERVLHVLHACEEQGVVRHGDLHSGNILIGDTSRAKLDDHLNPRAPVYVADFGYGMTGGPLQPKDDYRGLAQIINEIIEHVDYQTATATHRRILHSLKHEFGKLLRDNVGTERHSPLELLQALGSLKKRSQGLPEVGQQARQKAPSASTVGQFQVSEMIGDRWEWWKRLFIPSIPARSRILALDIPTVVTGPRGCGKTMLFRRLSERLMVECGDIPEHPEFRAFIAFYVNANDFADAFAWYPDQPSQNEQARLICYANLCLLSEVLTVQSARAARFQEAASGELLDSVQNWLGIDGAIPLLAGQDRLEHLRAVLEQLKWTFPLSDHDASSMQMKQLGQSRWLPRFIADLRTSCSWVAEHPVLLFIDDFSTPRVSVSMQRTLNRLFLQRSSEFLSKVATEAWSTFVPEDSSGKNLQDGDDYQLVDLGEEALFLPDKDRRSFLRAVFQRRLEGDPRIDPNNATLESLLGRNDLSKTEFARRLRSLDDREPVQVEQTSLRRGRAKGRVLYFGEDVFTDLWSGDTRTMIQLATDVIDQAHEARDDASGSLLVPVNAEIQDRAFRNRGGEWLNSHTRNEPTRPDRVKETLRLLQRKEPSYHLSGTYGDHLKAVVEAFIAAATALLMGPMYKLEENGVIREIPRMAFRIEIVDELRLDGLAEEIYRDLIRYGIFMRDNRGKSVRGAIVPRLYLRRLLLPFATLPMSKRDSVQVTAEEFRSLILQPDVFRVNFLAKRRKDPFNSANLRLPFAQLEQSLDARYDDLIEPLPLEVKG